jgi:hypothetical protein
MKYEIKIEELQKYSIFVGVPMYGGQCSGLHAKSSTDLGILCAKYGIKMNFYYLFNESLVQRARNYIVDEFMRSGYTHLMFIDADIGFNATDVLSLLGLQIMNPEEYRIITAPYPKKTIAWEKVYSAAQTDLISNPADLSNFISDFVFNPVKGITSFKLNEPVEVSEAGTGFMLIPRTTFEKYKEVYPQYSYKPDHIRTNNFDGSREIMAYFDCAIDPESKRYLSEDYFFCKNVRRMGYSIYMCPWMNLSHVGSYIFKGNMEAIARLGASPTYDKDSDKKVDKPKKKSIIKTRP